MRLGPYAALLLSAVAVMTSPAQEVGQDVAASVQHAQEGAGTQLDFSFLPNAPGQTPWEIRLSADHSGTYLEHGAGSGSQQIRVGEEVWKRLDAGAKTVRSGRCETKQKGIAQTGMKTMSVTSKDAPVSCTFNYSDSDALNDAASAFLALAETMQEGVKLQHDHRFDKLSLDVDIDTLVAAVAAGRALEPGNIAPVLQSIVDDDHVIDRVRRKAARLLQAAVDKPR